MNETSASRADSGRALVWDAPVRVFHWLMVLCFAGAWLTAESERFRLLHVTLGYTMAGLVGFRILWGLVGTRYARFMSFLPTPAAVTRYVGSIVKGRPEHHVGHNPVGSLGIVAMLLLTLVVVATGWANYNDIAGGRMEEIHEGAASLFLAVVVVHVVGVVAGSMLHRENLVAAMVSGVKKAAAGEGIRSAWRTVAIVLMLAVGGFWWSEWQSARVDGAPAAVAAATQDRKVAHDHD